MSNEGYIKFQCYWEKKLLPIDILFQELIHARDRLHSSGLIGSLPDGTGFGNLSIRYHLTIDPGRNSFIITGTQTGKKKNITPDDLTLVYDYSLSSNSVYCRGMAKASSESLSHAAAYESSKLINCVMHVHQLELWHELINSDNAIKVYASYGTTELAEEIKSALSKCEDSRPRLIVMPGHEGGIISAGENIKETLDYLLNNI